MILSKRYITAARQLSPRLDQCLSRSWTSAAAPRSYATMAEHDNFTTKVLPIDARSIGKVTAIPVPDDLLDEIDIQLDSNSPDAAHLRLAAEQLRHSNIPVAFPTETVYGLGADATRSEAVRGIYRAKRRPADNPLIVHFASLRQLRKCLRPSSAQTNGHGVNGIQHHDDEDPIPEIYKPLISKFWPGPLTIILPNPPHSPFAPEVTAGLDTFGARIPRHVLALALIQLADKPIAAPSANASTKPSPTAAEHVAHDLDGRIETILDGGPCDVGVESTVVDGLSNPPLILRPGGVSIEQLRSCPGWENTQVGYKDASGAPGDRPKAPGMKYRHYSPKATVVLYESGRNAPSLEELSRFLGPRRNIGVVTTKSWNLGESNGLSVTRRPHQGDFRRKQPVHKAEKPGFAGMLDALKAETKRRAVLTTHDITHNDTTFALSTIALGDDTASIARGIFSALRELDRKDVDAIFVEGIDDNEGDTASAVMNRLRKAAEIRVDD